MEIVHEQRDLERYMREAVKVSNDSPRAAGPLPVQRHRVRRGRHARQPRCTFIGGVMEHIEQAGVHSGDSACSLPPYYLSQPTIGESSARPPPWRYRPECGGPDERAVRHPGKPGQAGRDLRAGVNPAPRARCRSFPRPPGIQLAKVAARCMAGQTLASQGHHRSHPPYFSVKERVPVRQVPWRGHHPRPRDEVHRRSDGRGQDLWRNLQVKGSWAPGTSCAATRARCSSR